VHAAVVATRAALERTAERPMRAVLAKARTAAIRGDGARMAAELAGLAERERLVATVGLELLFPAVAGPAAVALDATLPRDARVVDWSELVPLEAMETWAEAALERVTAPTLAGLVARAFHVSAGRLAASLVRRAIARGRAGDARTLHASIPPEAKEARAVAGAVIALAEQEAEARDRGLSSAIDHASAEPIVQDGGEEVEALASLLAELAELPPSHRAVIATREAIERLCDRFIDRKDTRSRGAARALEACARASERDAGWLAHAHALRVWVASGPLREAADAAIARPASIVVSEAAPLPAPPLPELRGLRALAPRAFGAMAHVLAASRAERVEEGIEALSVAIEPTLALRASPELVARWLQHLPRDRAARVLAAWDEPVLPPLAYRLAPRVLEGAAARAFVERSLVHGRVYERYGDGYYRTELVAEVLGAVAAASDEETCARLLHAACAVRQHEDRVESDAWRVRRQRVRVVIAALAPRLGLDWVAARLPECDRARLAAASGLLAELGLAAACERVGGVIEPLDAPALAAALADRGRIDEAIELASALEPSAAVAAFLAIARPTLDAKVRRKLLAAFKKVPKLGRAREDQTLRAHQLARAMLRLGELEAALEALAELGDCRYADHGPAALAEEIVAFLDASPHERTRARIEAILDTLCSDRVIQQELARRVAPLLEWAVVHVGPEPLQLHVAALRHRCPGAAGAHVDAGLAAGLARRGESEAALRSFDDALAAAGRAQRTFFSPAVLARAAQRADLATLDPSRLAAVLTLLGRDAASIRACAPELRGAARDVLRAALPRSELPADARAALRIGLATADASEGDVDAVLRSLEACQDPREIIERAGELVCALAVRGELEASFAVAALVVMPVDPA
jgi:hypothetical protein